MGWKHYFRSREAQAQAQNDGSHFADAYAFPRAHMQQQQQRQSAGQPRALTSERDKRAAEALKAEGNTYFVKAKYGAAIEKYTEALTLWPGLTVLLVNRALCHKRREAWDLARQDSEAALTSTSQFGLNGSQLMRAHYVLGIALRHLEELTSSLQHLKQALELARQTDDNIKDEIWHELAQVQHKYWQHDAATQLAKLNKLQRRMQHVLQEQHLREQQSSASEASDAQQQEAAELQELFQECKDAMQAGEPASAFTCPITMEVFRDPVMTPSGLSYERTALLEHLKKNGAYDPITRQAMTVDQMVPNVALRSATLQYLEEHPWAWAECC